MSISADQPPVNRVSRAVEKAESRARDRARLEAGEDPVVIQRENSIFPDGFFEGAEISNLNDATGK